MSKYGILSIFEKKAKSLLQIIQSYTSKLNELAFFHFKARAKRFHPSTFDIRYSAVLRFAFLSSGGWQ
ncbi:hypothetical protein D1BOALGB6SA_8944 [Olavius sp. associated proteobacterium Delta 1]|nr:hypothetical protein D1BOALGB6SA_8944 [Olavius sp. associated proteobacterium Delta 1]